MSELCPFCTGRLKEKHDELVMEGKESFVVIHFRCLSCGKWAKKRTKRWDS